MAAVRLEQAPSIPLAVIRRQAQKSELSRVVPECCGLVWNAMRAQQVKAGRHVALYWDGSIRLEVGVEVSGEFRDQDNVVHSATPAGSVATITHYGPYGTLRTAHDAIHDWVKTNSRELAGPSWEIYGHWQDAWNTNPSLIRTDIFYLIKPA
jgi:effector-binding domain-containing protein